jgi:hypothetical protein
MAATKAFRLSPPTTKDLDAAEAAWREARVVHELAAGCTFFRVLKAVPPADPLIYARTCYPSDSSNRFSPIRLAGNIVPSAYAGATSELALWESVLRNIRHKGIKRVPQHETSHRYLIETRTTRRLRLLDIRRPKDANLVAGRKRPPKLSAAPKSAYNITREWAQQLYTRIPEIDGLLYESHQLPGDCVVLFQPKPVHPEVFEPIGAAKAVSDEPVRSLLRTEAQKAGAVVDFGHLPDPPDPTY